MLQSSQYFQLRIHQTSWKKEQQSSTTKEEYKKDDLNTKSQNNLYFLILLVIVLDPIRRYDFGRIWNIKERKALKRNKMPESMPEHIRIVNVAKQIHIVEFVDV